MDEVTRRSTSVLKVGVVYMGICICIKGFKKGELVLARVAKAGRSDTVNDEGNVPILLLEHVSIDKQPWIVRLLKRSYH